MRTPSLVISLTATVALLAGGCGADKKAATSTGSETTTTKPAAGPADVDKAVVLVEGIYADKKTVATGTVFSVDRGLVLTANHTVEAAPAIEVTLPNGTLVHGRPIARLQCHDLALLELFPKPVGVTAVTFADSRSVSLDQPVRTLSFELASATTKAPSLTSTQGTITAIGVSEAFPPLPATEPFIAHQTPLAASSSGSPLLNASGKMIGINTLVAHPRDPDKPGVEYALTANYIKARLAELKPGVGGALGGWQSEHNSCHAALRKLLGIGHVHTPGGTPTPPPAPKKK
jgi:putative serine protease PepD